MTGIIVELLSFVLLGAVAIVLILGIYTLFKGGALAKNIQIN